MRIAALSALFILSLHALGCGDSDDEKGDTSGTDAGTSESDNNGGGGRLQQPDDEDLNDCDKGDPCCINSDEYDFARCNTIDMDSGIDAAVPATTDAGPGDAGLGDAGQDDGSVGDAG